MRFDDPRRTRLFFKNYEKHFEVRLATSLSFLSFHPVDFSEEEFNELITNLTGTLVSKQIALPLLQILRLDF
jgi:hypothetical protein